LKRRIQDSKSELVFSKMTSYWTLAAVAITIAIVTFGIPLLLAEVFPWRSLWNQRRGRPTVRTDSYKGRTVLITGANGAFGSRAAKIFAHRDVETLILVDVKDCAGVKEQIEAELTEKSKAKPKVLVWQVDVMTFAGCQTLGKKACELKSLDHVLMTAGILSFNRRESPEGWETCKYPSFPHHLHTHRSLTSLT
jgi:short chain dehydrogenase